MYMRFSRLIHLLEATEFVTPEEMKKRLSIDKNFKDNCEKVIKLDQPFKSTKHNWWGMSLSTVDSCPWAGPCKDLCFRKRDERRWPHVNAKVESNFSIIKAEKTKDKMADLLERSIILEPGARVSPIFRIHNGGDFFSGEYFDAWIEVANRMPQKLFYTYTTSIPLFVKRKNRIPANMVITASWDTTPANQELIKKHKLKTAFIVDSAEQAAEIGLPVDTDDDMAWASKESFALVQHNTQAKNDIRYYIRNRTKELKEVVAQITSE